MMKLVKNAQFAWIASKQNSGFGSCLAATFITIRAYASGLKSTCIVLCADSIASKTSPQALEKKLCGQSQ